MQPQILTNGALAGALGGLCAIALLAIFQAFGIGSLQPLLHTGMRFGAANPSSALAIGMFAWLVVAAIGGIAYAGFVRRGDIPRGITFGAVIWIAGAILAWPGRGQGFSSTRPLVAIETLAMAVLYGATTGWSLGRSLLGVPLGRRVYYGQERRDDRASRRAQGRPVAHERRHGGERRRLIAV